MTKTDEEVIAEYRSLLGRLLDESHVGDYVQSFHNAKIEKFITTILAEQRAEILEMGDGLKEPLPAVTMTAREAQAHNAAITAYQAQIKSLTT